MSFKIAEDKHECTGKQECIPVGCVPPACLCLSYPSMHWAGGCIPACTGQGVSVQGVSIQGCLLRGVSVWGVCPGGVSAQEGCLPRRGVCPGGVSAQGCLLGGICLRVSAWGVSAWGGVCHSFQKFLKHVHPGHWTKRSTVSLHIDCILYLRGWGRTSQSGQSEACKNTTFTELHFTGCKYCTVIQNFTWKLFLTYRLQHEVARR